MESDEDHWEGWGDQEDGYVIDSDIDREIEHDISSMDTQNVSAKSEYRETSRTALSLSNLSHSSEQSLDLSDVTSLANHKDNVVPSRKGILKLAKTRTSPPPLPSPSGVRNTAEMSVRSPNRKHVHTPDAVQKDVTISQKKQPIKSNTALGAEFDIKAIDIKTDSMTAGGREQDFFADMEPVIKTDTDVLGLLIGKARPADNVWMEEAKASTLSFAVKNNTVSVCANIRTRCYRF